MRQGIGSYISQSDDLGQGSYGGTYSGPPRATVPIDVTLNQGQANQYVFTKNVEVISPGDILGIDTRNVVRVHPEPNTPSFTPNYLPFVEFYQDTFCWDYTPANKNGGNDKRLRPWLFLVVLEEGEYSFDENTQGPLPFLALSANQGDVFPPESQTWAWAHVHVNVDLSTNIGGSDFNDVPQGMAKLEAKMKSNPDFAVSRIICPRKLEAEKRYEAFVIPAFETGRLAGLGVDDSIIQGVNPQMPAWNVSSGHSGYAADRRPNEFPVFYSWTFQTGPRGDFESLVRKLQSRALDPELGFRPMDVQEDSPFGIPGITSPSALPLGGALKLPVTPVDPWTGTPRTNWEKALAELLNTNEHIKYPDPNFINFVQNPFTGTPADSDPVVTPPMYGRYHAIVRTIEPELGGAFPTTPANHWVREMNLDPRNRAAAGLGTLIIQENQARYLQIAWEQLGSVLEANALLRQSQLSIEIVVKLMERHMSTSNPAKYLQMAAPLIKRVLCGNATLWAMIEPSCLTTSLLDPAFRKSIRMRGRIARKAMLGAGAAQGEFIDRASTCQISAAPDKEIWTRKIRGNEAVQDAELTARTFLKLQGNLPPWVYSEPVTDPRLVVDPKATDPYETGLFYDAAVNLFSITDQTFPQPPARTSLNLASIKICLDTTLNIPEQFRKRNITKIGTAAAVDGIVPIMAAPDYTEPMYKKLLDKSPEYILPNLEKLLPETISILETNQPFIESFMVGLNVEMGRELIWNEYPTDQRGSFFRQFWDVATHIDTQGYTPPVLADKLKDIDYIHKWTRFSHLGEHNNRATNPQDPSLVLVVRGELLNRFPDITFYALKATWNGNVREIEDPENRKDPIFIAKISPDITFFGFDLTVSDAKGDTMDAGWFFAVKENPSGPRFGLDVAPTGSPGTITSWDDVNWGHMGASKYVNVNANLGSYYQGGTPPGTGTDNNPGMVWGNNSADMAYITYQVPFFMAIHATEMLDNV